MAIPSLPTYAALPVAIQNALTKAELNLADISVIITPVGEKNASRLPPVVHVVDSDANAAFDASLSANTDLSTTKQITSNVISKQAIQQKERQLQAYTDDAYAYQSIESIPSLLAINNTKMQTSKSSVKSSRSSTILTLTSIISHLPNTPRTPASTMKLIPSFIALDTLGPNFRWYTKVYHNGTLVGDRLYGDLIIQGSGDPKLTHQRLQQLLYQVQKTGIQHISGDIVIDSAIFNSVSKNPAAFDNAPLRPYNASPDGFLVNFSNIGIKSKPLSDGTSQLTYTPNLANYQLPTTIQTRTAACSLARRSLAPKWQNNQLVFNADLPSSCAEHLFYIAYPDAKDFASRVVAAQWQALGNTLDGEVIAQETPYSHYFPTTNSTIQTNYKSPKGLTALGLSPLPIVSFPSLTLTQQIYDINHFSNNVLTEQVALSIAAYSKTNAPKPKTPSSANSNSTSLYQFGQPHSIGYSDALQTMDTWWQTNLTTSPPQMTNGSGLCRDCTVTAANLEELLNFAYAHPSFSNYAHSLGVAGVTGTILYHSERLPNSAAIGRAWIKTGTLNNVTSMAGYVKGQSGQDYTVVGLINTKQALNPYVARPVLDAMLDWTAQQ